MAAQFTMILATLVALSGNADLGSPPAQRNPTGRAFTAAEQLFRQDTRWLGADAALSIPLDHNRTVWLFGDTFVAKTDAHVRSESAMVRNTVAIQTGTDPCTASLTCHWQQNSDGSPASFFPEGPEHWYWPGHGIRLDEGPLVIFLYVLVATPGQDLGFKYTGYTVAIINNPDEPPAEWRPRLVEIPASPVDAIPATAVVQDGDYIVALAIRQKGIHAGTLVRYRSDQLAAGDVEGAEWWAGQERGWVTEAKLGADGPVFMLNDAGSECSLHWDERTGSFIHVASYGFGATTIGLCTAPALTGPWSSPVTVYCPPESAGPRPFVYAAKAHPELKGPDPADLVITYATNSFEFGDLFTPQGTKSLYWPRMVLVPVFKQATADNKAE